MEGEEEKEVTSSVEGKRFSEPPQPVTSRREEVDLLSSASTRVGGEVESKSTGTSRDDLTGQLMADETPDPESTPSASSHTADI